MAKSLDLTGIVGSALRKVADLMSVDVSCLYLVEDERLVLKGYHGLSSQTANDMMLIPADGDIIGEVFHRAEPAIIEKIAVRGEPTLDCLARDGYASYAGIPLRIVGECIGVMGIAMRSQRKFTSREIKLLAAIGKEISIAVRNAQLYEEASSARALRELDAMRTQFLANVSHELRTPLSVIKGSASSLIQPDVDFDEQTWREFVQSIDKDADTLTRLVEDLLTMSRLEAGALGVSKVRHNLAEVVSHVKDRLDSLSSKHRLLIDIPRDLPPVMADIDHVGEVFTNLVENAVKYSPEGSKIAIAANANGSEIIIGVTDEGAGIPPEFHQKIFDRFYRGDNSSEYRKGAGLGLSICRGIVEAHGGKIWVDSSPGKGSTFNFSLPMDGGGEV